MKKMILLLTILTLVAFVSGVMAQQKPAPAPAPAAPAKEVKIEKFTGAVEKVDEMAKAVVVKDKKGEKTFSIDDKTKITKGEKDMPLAELKKGTNVSIEYKKDGEKLVAVTIKAAAPKPAAKK